MYKLRSAHTNAKFGDGRDNEISNPAAAMKFVFVFTPERNTKDEISHPCVEIHSWLWSKIETILLITIVADVYIRFYRIISVLPKGRSITANSGTKAEVLPKGRHRNQGCNCNGSWPALCTVAATRYGSYGTLQRGRGNWWLQCGLHSDYIESRESPFGHLWCKILLVHGCYTEHGL